jgi:integrase
MSTENTMGVLFEEFLKLRNVSAGTAEIYRFALKKFGLPDPEKVSKLDAMRFVNGLSESLSPTSVNMYLRAMKAFFNFLVEVEVLAKSPFEKVKGLKETQNGKAPYETGEIERLLSCCPNDRWRLIVVLAFTTGMRRGEILNLTVKEIDYLNQTITVRPKEDTTTTWKWTIKDHESRTLPMTDLAERYLLRLQAALPEGQPYICLAPARYQHLIRKTLKHRDRICPEQNFIRTFQGICNKAGVKYRTFHAARGTSLSMMAETLQPHELKAIAGHSDVRTTYRHYVRPQQTLLTKARNAVQKMGDAGHDPAASCL